MKIFSLISVILVLVCSMGINATNYKFVGVDTSKDTKMCLAVATNNKRALQSLMLRTSERVGSVARNLKCNNQVIANFAFKYNASETFEYLNRFTPKKYQELRSKVTIQDLAAQDNDKTIVVLIASN